MLRITDSKGHSWHWPVDRPTTLIGSRAVCDLRLESDYVSRVHAMLEKRSTGYYLKDLMSSAGTFVDGRKIDRPVRLELGMTIRISDFDLTFVTLPETCDDASDDGSTVLLTKELSEALRPISSELFGARIEALLELSRNLGRGLHSDQVLEAAVPTLFRLFPLMEGAVFVLLGESSRRPVCRVARRRDGTELPKEFSRTIVKRVLERTEVVLSRNPPLDFPDASSLAGLQGRCLLCAPLIDSQGTPLGVLQLGFGAHIGPDSPAELHLAAMAARQVGVAIENARLRRRFLREAALEEEMLCARQVLMALLPSLSCEPPGYECWSHYQPARHVGGDYLGCFPLSKPTDAPGAVPTRWALAVGDVAGKGMPAALFMARLSAEVRLVLREQSDPARALDALDQCLSDSNGEYTLVTFALAILDMETHRLTVAGAGHYPPLVLRARDGSLEELGAGTFGLPLGFEPITPHRASETTLEPGDIVVLFTDGVCDVSNKRGRSFTHPEFMQLVSRSPGRPAAIGSAILQAIAEFTGRSRQLDDIALLCLGRRP
jgi:serine phosphatase RsbU (regulator of sigma subunit)